MPKMLVRPPQALKSKLGPVTIPETENENEPPPSNSTTAEAPEEKQHTAHLEFQWLPAKLGNAMGLDVWIARNDAGKSYNGQKFTTLKRLRDPSPADGFPNAEHDRH